MKELQDILREARSLPDEFSALATVVRTAGSSYRRPGTRLLVRQDGKSIGAISGGCLEDEEQFRRADEIVIGYSKEFEIMADAQTAAMIMTHSYGRDLAWLRAFLPTPLRYVGLLGPKRRREKLLAGLAEHGLKLSHISLAHLYNPAGLDLGAESPEEIVLSIAAEIKMVLSCCGGGSLRSRKGAPSTTFVLRLAGRAKPSRLSYARRRNHSRGGGSRRQNGRE